MVHELLISSTSFAGYPVHPSAGSGGPDLETITNGLTLFVNSSSPLVANPSDTFVTVGPDALDRCAGRKDSQDRMDH
jgi:hypothetical protein